ncbi:MAG: hypothetical protein OCC46_06585 [Pseudodesulfovibrio sp.]
MIETERITNSGVIYTPENEPETEEVKNRKTYHTNRSRQIHYISYAVYPDWVKTKKDKTTFLQMVQDPNSGVDWRKDGVRTLFKDLEHSCFAKTQFIINVGYLDGKRYPNLQNGTDGIQSDVLVVDFDNTKTVNRESVDLFQGDEGYLSYDVLKGILDGLNINYILSTSSSHTSKQHKMHVFVPLLEPCTSNEMHRAYFDEFMKNFEGYVYDSSVGNISRCVHGGNINNFDIHVELDRNDYHLPGITVKKKKHFKRMSNIAVSKPLDGVSKEDTNLYVNQAKNMYGLRYGCCRSGTIRFFRAGKDEHPDVYNVPFSESYKPELIFANGEGEGKTYETFFSQGDYCEAREPEEIREMLQRELLLSIPKWYNGAYSDYNPRMYVITNEGLGKSRSVLELAKEGKKFIYAFPTIDGVKEKAKYLNNMGVRPCIVKGGKDLLADEGFDEISEMYMGYFDTTTKPTFDNFLKGMVQEGLIEEADRSHLYSEYVKNNEQINEDAVILMTTKKLAIMHIAEQADMLSNKKHIIVDEYTYNEWNNETLTKPKNGANPISCIGKTWGNGIGSYDRYKNDSFFELLKFKKVLVLSTERRLLEMYFSGSDYKELLIGYNPGFEMADNWILGEDQNRRFDRKLYAPNVRFHALKSTRKKDRPDWLDNYVEDEKNIICDGMKNSGIETKSHLGVKGMNGLDEQDSVVVGTVPCEKVLKEVYVNCKEFLENMFKEEILEKLNEKDLSSDEYNKALVRKSEEYIKEVMIETQVSQSIGRNSGFRYKGYKCDVFIPILHSKSFNRFGRSITSNYVTEDVCIERFDSDTKELIQVTEF